MTTVLAILTPFLISAALIPAVKRLSYPSNAWAKINNRTIHHGRISRIGGIAIYVAFSVALMVMSKADRSITGIYLASSAMFFIGLTDDFLDLPAKLKFVLQVLASLILLYFGVRVDTLHILGYAIRSNFICSLFTILWVVGITNAINLLDGLDGLCGGMILVVLSVICAISIVDRRGDMVLLSLMLSGAILGFLLYNAHPASIFMGDCGSLFLGCMVASFSLLGFKSSTTITLGLPILTLFLPIIDTFSAILRRKIKNIPVDQADRSHLHHQLLRRFGQTNSVIIMCGITFLFGMSAFVYIYSRKIGIVLILGLLFGVELFIERTGMISDSFHPFHSAIRFVRRLFQKAVKKIRKRKSS
ncbi:MraY family glycosyltransferase [Allobaculum mucilyticum]|uniref:MraY family glycosyltransferase n=1 Tax=Allobaculum mucilyticum TaxID=2834459 RepID=UPI001E3119BA|nr:MraY family glycosyltransferase [Allobaculum mucilyticum]UNT96859.1 undecaprenyl/decaprenyl-phosphate alpha-N-acetylglucosaminyl 1-phosphate transferase [Allobaculum mucilyticum]